MSGFPRSGSTLLCGILSQNPAFKIHEASTLLPLICAIRVFWMNSLKNKSINNNHRLLPVLKSAFSGYYHNDLDKIIIDKNRAWPLFLDLADKIFDNYKIIATVRNPLECLASFDRLKQKDSEFLTQIETATEDTGATTFDRMKSYASPDGTLGYSYTALYEALIVQKRHESFVLVDYHKLCNNPQEQIDRIYDFLKLPKFNHTFTNIENAEIQNDWVYEAFPSLHNIESKLRLPNKNLDRTQQYADAFNFEEFWLPWI